MKKLLLISLFFFAHCNSAHAYLWTSAIPTEIHIVADGLLLIGDFENTGVLCATGSKAIFLPKTDAMFKEKLTLALTAKATGRRIRVLIDEPVEINCFRIPMIGSVPVASHYFWQLKD